MRGGRKNMKVWDYLCGLIAADGHLDEEGYITISQKDRRFIDKIVALLKSAEIKISSLFYDKGAGVWKIKIKDERLYRYLVNNGVIPGKKAHVLRPPSSAVDPLWYIIGFIDGDGWVEQVVKRAGDKSYYYIRIGIKTKSKELRDWIAQTLNDLGIRASRADKSDGYEVHIDGVEAWRLVPHLQNPTHLERAQSVKDNRLSLLF
uniref:Putative homing endonuclease n=1 Tax=Thermoproteus sp. IC-062 TaxID=278052 RepID=Q8J309_9CREN|nr:putative homing endonuclease [Thermoproteus sp. IC-062]